MSDQQDQDQPFQNEAGRLEQQAHAELPQNREEAEPQPVLIEAFDDEIAPMSPSSVSLSSSSDESSSSGEESDDEEEDHKPAAKSTSNMELHVNRPANTATYQLSKQDISRHSSPSTSSTMCETSYQERCLSSIDEESNRYILKTHKDSKIVHTTKKSTQGDSQTGERELKKGPRVTDHTYRDLSQIPADMKHAEMMENKEGKFGFLIKLHEILDKFPRYIDWAPHGRCFRIIVPKRLETHVFADYFNFRRLNMFVKQLINWGFKHITRGRDRNSYYNEAFLRGLPHLCRYMTYKVRSRQRPDPANEPCFYRIHQISPLPFSSQVPEESEIAAQAMNSISNSLQAEPGSIEHQHALWVAMHTTSVPVNSSHCSSLDPLTPTTRNISAPLESIYAAPSGANPLNSSSTLASMVVRFSMETNRMSQAELEASLHMNLLQQQHLLRCQNQQGNVSMPNSLQQPQNLQLSLDRRMWQP